MHPRTRLLYFYFFRVNFLVKASTSGRCDQVWLPWQRCMCRSRYGCFCLSPQVTYLHTKIEGGLKFFIFNFASLSWRIALKHPGVSGFKWSRRDGSLASRNDLVGCPYPWISFVASALTLIILRSISLGLFRLFPPPLAQASGN